MAAHLVAASCIMVTVVTVEYTTILGLVACWLPESACWLKKPPDIDTPREQ